MNMDVLVIATLNQKKYIFKIFTDCHLKTFRSLKRRDILKISSTVFRGT